MRADMAITFAGTLLDALMERCWFLHEDGLECPVEDQSANNHEGVMLHLCNFPGHILISLIRGHWKK